MTDNQHYKSIRRVLWAVLVANLAITIVKITLGLITGALAVVADGFHSLVDSSSNLIGLAAIRFAERPADERHPYGYRRYETLGALAIGGLLLAAAWEIGNSIVERIVSGASPEITTLTMILMALTFPVNVLVVILETRAGKRLGSEILLADAKHTQTDLFVTGSVVISMLGVWAGLSWLDVIVASAVILLILRAAFEILRDASRYLTDTVIVAPERVETIARAVEGVRFVHNVRSRGTPDSAFVDLHVKVAPGMSTEEAHRVASEVEYNLKHELTGVTDALVHIEPAHQESYTPWETMVYDLRRIADGLGVGVHDIHIHTNPEGKYMVEVHLEITKEVTLSEAHALADQFESRVKERWPEAESVLTHLEPIPEAVLPPADSPDPAFTQQIEACVARHIAPEHIRDLHVYNADGHLHAAITICLPGELPLVEAHSKTEQLETDLLNEVHALHRVTVHVEPIEAGAETCCEDDSGI